MIMMNHVRCAALCSAVTLLAACGQSTNTPSTPAANATPAAAPAATTNPPPPENAPANAPQNGASLAEILGPNQGAQSAPQSTPPLNGNARTPPPASNPPADTVRTADSVNSTAPVPDADFARVVSVQPVKDRVCTDQTVTERRRPEDRHQVTGTVIGALVGGAIGNRIGRGSGRTIATVGGAVGGGAIGKHIQKEHQANDTVTHVVRRCHDTADARRNGQTMTLYDVVYAYNGQSYKVRLDYDPGDRVQLPVRGILE